MAEDLEKGALGPAGLPESNGDVALLGKDPSLRRPLQVAFLDKVGLMNFLKGFGLFPYRNRDRAHADGTSPVVFGQGSQHPFVHLVEPGSVDLKQLESR